MKTLIRRTNGPVLFSTPMVEAIKLGHKWQTRRVVKHQPTGKPMPREEWGAEQRHLGRPPAGPWMWPFYAGPGEATARGYHCPYGRVGDTLWVRETWAADKKYDKFPPRMIPAKTPNGSKTPIWYKEACLNDGQTYPPPGRWRPSIFMPEWASRTKLKITEVRMQRLQDLSEKDAKAEGVNRRLETIDSFKSRFQELWDNINGRRKGCAWKDNPWVWAVSFKKVK